MMPPRRTATTFPTVLRPALFRSASLAALALAISATPAGAQLARLNGGVAPSATGTRAPTGTIPRSVNMREALAAQQSARERAAALRTYVVSVRQAAAAARPNASSVTNGIGPNGLYPVQSIRNAMAIRDAGGATSAAQVAQILDAARAAVDTTGKATWEGAGLPTQTVANGQTTVTIDQTQARALLSWDRLDVGANTTLAFNQKQNGVAQTGWIAVNRVVDATDPTTILGKITADGGVYILNRQGVIFGKGSQVNLRSLVASSLDLGNYASGVSVNGTVTIKGLSLQARNIAYLQNGVFQTANNPTFVDVNGAPALFLSPLLSTDPVAKTSTGSIDFETGQGAVEVDAGASITTGEGGLLLLAAPRVVNEGTLGANNGQVSLVGGQLVSFVKSDGSSGGADPDVRGVVFRSLERDNREPDPLAQARPEDGVVINRGLVESRRGYISLVASSKGEVVNGGLLSASTSVARNGKIGLYAGRVTIEGNADPARAGGITITADDDGQTIPQGSAAEAADFKRSQIEIGTLLPPQKAVGDGLVSDLLDPRGDLGQTAFVMGQNALIQAPNARLAIGGARAAGTGTAIDIGAGALIDLSGLKAVEADVARNYITIDPVKRNELRDTPTYREATTDGGFTLNGTTLTVDIRRSGVRDDGTRWVGSPLLEAGSLASQISIDASEFMTRGGDISFATGSTVSIAKGAVVDVSGGWISYVGQEEATSRLRTADGRIVDIADADPNERYVGLVEGYTVAQPRFDISRTYSSPTISGTSAGVAYDEGRDAGTLVISSAATRVDGVLRAAAYAGQRQLASAITASGASALAGDPRKLQASSVELPSGGYASLGTSGDIVIYRGTLDADRSRFDQMLLDDGMLSRAGFSGLRLRASGSITVAGADTPLLADADAVTLTGAAGLTLADGGALILRAGRTIRFDGSVTAAGGLIDAQTLDPDRLSLGRSASASSVISVGSTFRTDDDILAAYADGASAPSPYDIVVNGTLSTAGRWTNDSRFEDVIAGGGWIDGGTIRLTVNPSAFAFEGSPATAQRLVDLSGSILVNAGARLNVSAGGYFSPQQRLDLTGKGGNVALVNETIYYNPGLSARLLNTNGAVQPLGGTNQSVGLTPRAAGDGGDEAWSPSLVAATRRSRVAIDGTIDAFGFAGGGTFTLVSPDIGFGADSGGDGATRIGLDFAARTGFGTLALTSNRTRVVEGLFDNGGDYLSAFADTTTFRVADGETLDLTQTLLPLVAAGSLLDRLNGLATGGDLLSVLTPESPSIAFDRRAIDLRIGGYGELVVDEGGAIVGAPAATITAPKIINQGTITLPGGTLRVSAEAANTNVASAFVGVRSLADLLGRESGNDENAANRLVRGADGALIANRDLFSSNGSDRSVLLLGEGDLRTGIRLDAGSVTDLSGTAVYDPRAAFIEDRTTGTSVQGRVGRLYGGGSIIADAAVNDEGETRALLARTVDMAQGAIVDLSGARATFDSFVAGSGYRAFEQWSAGGTLSMLGGGSIAGARINAFGGYGEDGGAFLRTGAIDRALVETRAEGGKLAALNPTLVEGEAAAAALANGLSADQIERAGFDSLLAVDGARFAGDVDLSLRRSFVVTGALTRTGKALVGDAPLVTAGSGSAATVSAAYVSFRSTAEAALAPNQLGQLDAAVATPGTLDIVAGGQGIDFVGASYFGQSIGTLGFATSGDIRFIGVDARTAIDRADDANGGRLDGGLLTFADMRFEAARSYATTGTGNLQLFIDAERAGREPAGRPLRPFQVTAAGGHGIRFVNAASTPDTGTPLSAGSYLRIVADTIAQDGVLAAPLGRLELGSASYASSATDANARSATSSVTFGENSLTSVSAGSSKIPYGTTLDLKDYFFTPFDQNALTALPTSELRVAGGDISVGAGATLDLSGGGDVFGYEFVSGVGGSRDVLDRFNSDLFSSNGYDPATGRGYQYADGRQVYAIVPKAQAQAIAAYDPLYSADYGSGGPSDLYGAQVGRTVVLDGGNGIAAGEYVLMPAHYALLDGAYRVVENVGRQAPDIGRTQTLLDGSIIMGGSYGYAGTGIVESGRQSFTIQSQDTFKRYSRIETTSGSTYVEKGITDNKLEESRLPADAARLVLKPLGTLSVAGTIDADTDARARGLDVDIAAQNIILAAAGAPPVDGFVTIDDLSLGRLGAQSLFVGGERTDRGDGTTALGVTASQIRLDDGFALALPEMLFAVGNGRDGTSSLSIGDGVALAATGALDRPSGADYVVDATGDTSGAGSVLRVANGPDRAIRSSGNGPDQAINAGTRFVVGAATLSADTLTLMTTRQGSFADGLALDARSVTLGSDNIVFDGTVIGTGLQAQLAAVETLTLQSRQAVGFAGGDYSFNNLTIDAPGIALANLRDVRREANSVAITTGALRLQNSGATLGACKALICGGVDDLLAINATALTLGSGTVRTIGFGGTVTVSAANGAFVEGKGALDVGTARLALVTPVIADRSPVADPRQQALQPDYRFGARQGIAVSAGDFTVPASISAVAGNRAPGARINFGDSDTLFGTVAQTDRAVSVTDTLVLATAGVIGIDAGGSVTIGGRAVLAAPGWTKTFGDQLDNVTIAASGGSIDVLARGGDLSFGGGATLVSDTGTGKAGSIALRAPNGAVRFDGTLNPGLSGARASDFTLDSGTGAFDLAGFVSRFGAGFGGDLSIRSGAGNLALNAGQTIRATSVSLTADGGLLSIGGTIDTSGASVAGLSLAEAKNAAVNGGDIALYGAGGVTLLGSARLDTHSTGYADGDARQASAGDVTIGTGSGAIGIADGAVVDVGARRTQAALAAGKPGARLVAETAKSATLVDQTVYRYVEADQGGSITLRAPVIGSGGDQVDIRFADAASAFVGARDVQIEGYRRYDLDAIATRGDVTGVSAVAGGVTLDPSAGAANRYADNLLSGDFVTEDGLESISHFVRNFDVRAADGITDFTGLRLRPGVDLASSGSITLTSAWNLAAADIDTAGALAGGAMAINTELGLRDESYGLNQAGTPYLNVVAGQEGNLLENYANFYYRVGGRASGEAPLIHFRAAGDVTVGASINDGFFVFRDRSDQAYVTYQLGGGTRAYNAGLRLTCGAIAGGRCDAVADIADDVPVQGRNVRAVKIALNAVDYGGQISARTTAAPFSAEANSPAALGNVFDANTGERIAGASLTFGELFPLFADGSAMRSSDISLTAGGAGGSANADYVNGSRGSDVIVTDTLARRGRNLDPLTYTFEATRQAATVGGALDILSGNRDAVGTIVSLDDLLADPAGDFAGLTDSSFTILTWGELQSEGSAYFGARGRTFTGTRNNPTGVVAPLAEVVAFLKLYADDILARVGSGAIRINGSPPGQANRLTGQALVQTVLRTGDGDIRMNAARDIDLQGGDKVLYRQPKGLPAGIAAEVDGRASQLGGTAVYTAGVRVGAATLIAQKADGSVGSAIIDEAMVATLAEDRLSVPTPALRTDRGPVLAHDGGALAARAGRDVLGRLDDWSGQATLWQYDGVGLTNLDGLGLQPRDGTVGTSFQTWRAGSLADAGDIAGILPEYFRSGLGALAGGDVDVAAGRDVRDLTVALDSGAAKTLGADTVLASFGAGNLTVASGRDLVGGQFDISAGQARFDVGGDVVRLVRPAPRDADIVESDATTIRLDNATVDLAARGRVAALDSYGLGVRRGAPLNSADTNDRRAYSDASLYAPVTALRVTALGDIGFAGGDFVAPTLELASLRGSVGVANQTTLYPSPIGQLSLLSAGDIGNLSIAMLDIDPSYLVQSAFSNGSVVFEPRTNRLGSNAQGAQLLQLPASFPGVNSLVDEVTRRLQHNSNITHRDDRQVARVYTDGSLADASINLAKAANVRAGVDIVDTYFVGQNVRASDETRISAGRDITASNQSVGLGVKDQRPYYGGTTFILGGPGTLSVEAGRNLGPFATSAVIRPTDTNLNASLLTYAGGILTVGNDNNPWLEDRGADINVSFGVGKGQDLDALRETYLNPANFARLDGDLFVQTTDSLGNPRPDRSRQVYAPRLARWLRDNEPALFAQVFGPAGFADDAAMAQAAYGQAQALYTAFSTLSLQRQRRFLVNDLYFGELVQASRPTLPFQDYVRENVPAVAIADWLRSNDADRFTAIFGSASADVTAESARANLAGLYGALGTLDEAQQSALLSATLGLAALPDNPSFQQYIRGYRAVDTLFSPELGYTDNLAAYDTDPASVDGDHPLGVPRRRLGGDGQPVVADRVRTGDADLRLSTVESGRGGDITVLAPGGDFIVGSVVRTSEQTSRRNTRFYAGLANRGLAGIEFGDRELRASAIAAIPLGYEGLLTLRGGSVRSFTDGDLRLNQSRLFTLAGGDITAWSSNGDLNAGQGPKTAANFPPVTVRFDLNGNASVDTAGGVAGAGIASFKQAPSDPNSAIFLVAPVGEVDAGDAGVRASGSIFVAAARVANADNFNAGGSISGVPTGGPVVAAAPPGAAASAVANVARVGQQQPAADRRTSITVDVLGFAGGDTCSDPTVDDPACPR
jgi:filamentous hemagglutinin family protein